MLLHNLLFGYFLLHWGTEGSNITTPKSCTSCRHNPMTTNSTDTKKPETKPESKKPNEVVSPPLKTRCGLRLHNVSMYIMGKNGDKLINMEKNPQLSLEGKKIRVINLIDEISHVISEDVIIASQTLASKGQLLDEKEAADYYKMVAYKTLHRIESYVNELMNLVKDTDKVARLIAKSVSKEAYIQAMKRLTTRDPSALEIKAINKGISKMTEMSEEFIKKVLKKNV